MLQEKVIVTHVKNNKMRGYLFSESFLPVQREDGSMVMEARIGVLWDNVRTPAVSYHKPEELAWLALEPVETDAVEYEEAEADETDDEGEEAEGFEGAANEASI